MDYWGNCMLEGVAWSADKARSSGRAITISGNPWSLVQLDSERFKEVDFTMPWRPHNLSVQLARGTAQGVRDLANRKDALYRVETPDGAVLCAVFPGPNFAEVEPHLPLPPRVAAQPDEAAR